MIKITWNGIMIAAIILAIGASTLVAFGMNGGSTITGYVAKTDSGSTTNAENVYTQAEVDAMLDSFNSQVSSLNKQVSELNAQVQSCQNK
jgi:hypothetical protein